MYTLDSVPTRAFALVVLFHAAVLAFVSVPASRLGEGLATHPALVRFFTSVSELVFLETGHLGKTLGTRFELAGVGSLSRVYPYVVLEIAGGGERLGTICVGAHERPLAGVHASVDVEVLRRVEALPAAREIALARPVGDVDLLDV